MAIVRTLPALAAVVNFSPAITAAYLWFAVNLGPRLMRDRLPLRVKPLMPFYNALQVALNAILLRRSIPIFLDRRYDFACPRPFHTLRTLNGGVEKGDEVFMQEILFIGQCQAALRILDLLDTVFMVALKKNSNISFLHLYHHTTMVLTPWLILKLDAGASTGLLAVAVNNFVHCVMYTYYLLSLFDIPSVRSWRKYITQLQILQFFLVELYLLQTFLRKDCNTSLAVVVMMIIQGIAFIALFAQFYSKAYKAKKDV